LAQLRILVTELSRAAERWDSNSEAHRPFRLRRTEMAVRPRMPLCVIWLGWKLRRSRVGRYSFPARGLHLLSGLACVGAGYPGQPARVRRARDSAGSLPPSWDQPFCQSWATKFAPTNRPAIIEDLKVTAEFDRSTHGTRIPRHRADNRQGRGSGGPCSRRKGGPITGEVTA
jgi:hypothetical protein